MTMGVAGPGRRNGGRGWLPRWPRPSRGGWVVTLAAILVGVAGAVPAQAAFLIALLPAFAAIAASRHGSCAGAMALTLAILALLVVSMGLDWEPAGRGWDPFALAGTALAGAVVIERIARLRAEATARTAAAAALEQERDDRCTLLVELGHRVGNDLASLQATASLLSMGAQGAEARAVLSDMIGRLRLFGGIYRRLGADPFDVSPVAMRAFLDEFCAELREVHLGVRPITLDVEVDDLSLPSGQAVLVGLLLNEGITNALKHAFPESRPGHIVARLARDEDQSGCLVLSVTDDGIGLPAAALRGRGLGTRLLHALASQLDGCVAFGMEDGRTVLSIRFAV